MRYLYRLRELQLRDLGGLVFDLYRFGEQRDALVRGKLDALMATDKEIRELESALGRPRGELVVRQPGVGGSCASCGELHSAGARYCATCGVDLEVAAAAERAAAEQAAAPPPFAPAGESGQETEAEPPDEIDPAPADEAAEDAAAAEEEMPDEAARPEDVVVDASSNGAPAEKDDPAQPPAEDAAGSAAETTPDRPAR